YDLSQIVNMDETPVYFDMAGTYTINQKSAKTVQIRTTKNEKNQFICILAITTSGEKLLPMVIFKGIQTPYSFEGHKTNMVNHKCAINNIHKIIISGGLTSIVQPLDYGIFNELDRTEDDLLYSLDKENSEVDNNKDLLEIVEED
ncbi:24839_t:CDS:2, partial [Gigaspora margarita]